jgi:K+-sensing histidine kinase KdpD
LEKVSDMDGTTSVLTQQLAKFSDQLQARDAASQIINRIQQGLAAKLGFQGIIELVGGQIRQLFTVDAIFIALYNHETQSRVFLRFT